MKISVLVTSFNSAPTLELGLQAIKKSAFKNYELIVVDDGSVDSSPSIAKRYADVFIQHDLNLGRVKSRIDGMRAAKGDIIVNIDSDVVIKSDSLTIIADDFQKNPEVDAVTGMLSKECPHSDFCSQYKNLYMFYIFKKLPETVSFLYGSFFAFRKGTVENFESVVTIADDTALGQHLIKAGKRIGFLRTLEVIHLKEFTLNSLIKNDFRIPFDWTQIFMHSKGWKQLGKNKTGFAHASKGQIAGVLLAPLILFLLFFHLFFSAFLFLTVWFFLNFDFFRFLFKEKGAWFGVRSIVWTFFDHLVMFSGICCGCMATILNFKKTK